MSLSFEDSLKKNVDAIVMKTNGAIQAPVANMNDIDVANHAAMTLYIKTDVPVVKDAMLRKKAE